VGKDGDHTPLNHTSTLQEPLLKKPKKSQRFLLKISGELFQDLNALHDLLHQLTQLSKTCGGIVLGGGNYLRGTQSTFSQREYSDDIGMCGSVLNALFLRAHLKEYGLDSQIFSPLLIEGVTMKPSQQAIDVCLSKHHIPLFGGGIGQPYFSTDTAAVLYALRTKSDVVLKGTKVEGVYDKDPMVHKDARFLPHITSDMFLEKKLTLMDQTAIALARDHHIPLRIFSMKRKKSLVSVLDSVPPFTQIDHRI